MWSHNKFGAVSLAFAGLCWLFVIGPMLSPVGSAITFALVILCVVRCINWRNDSRVRPDRR